MEMQLADIVLAGGSILATYLEIRKDTSCWWYWIVCNIGYAILYLTQDADSVMYLYSGLMIVLAIFSYMAKKSWEKSTVQS